MHNDKKAYQVDRMLKYPERLGSALGIQLHLHWKTMTSDRL